MAWAKQEDARNYHRAWSAENKDKLRECGWICHKCNCGIGLLGDNEFGLQRAIMYLARSQYTNKEKGDGGRVN